MLTNRLNLLLILVAGAALAAVFVMRELRTETTVPDELIGVWTTSEPRYADRYFELKKHQLILGTGGSTSVTGPITAVEGDSETEEVTNPIMSIEGVRAHESILYSIEYRTFNEDPEGSTFVFSFYYYPEQKMIQFKNQKEFQWVKKSEDPS